jgi:hypothetical protein
MARRAHAGITGRPNALRAPFDTEVRRMSFGPDMSHWAWAVRRQNARLIAGLGSEWREADRTPSYGMDVGIPTDGRVLQVIVCPRAATKEQKSDCYSKTAFNAYIHM